MAWNKEQNPTGYSMPATNPLVPATRTTADEEAEEILRAQTSGRSIPSSLNDLPIAANARKADGFLPKATSAGQ
jgi:hypothetical protein